MSSRLQTLSGFDHARGKCYTAPTPADAPEGDDMQNGQRSTLCLYEDGIAIGPAHALHDDIARDGGGRFSHWGRWLMFSSSDGSDPRENGRRYSITYWAIDDPRIATLIACQNVDYERLGPEQRYLWAERAFNSIVPDVRLSEFGRTIFADTGFRADYERFDRSNYRSYDRKFALLQLLKLALPLDGDLAECGVFRGASAYMMAKAMAGTDVGRKLHLFDSFQGVSEPEPSLDGSYWQRGSLSCGFREVAVNLQPVSERVEFHPGWIPEKFFEVGEKRFSFVHIDVDLHRPTRNSLDFFYPRMVPEGVIVCDDYGFETCPGARKAMDDFAADHNLPVIHLPTGQGVIFVERGLREAADQHADRYA